MSIRGVDYNLQYSLLMSCLQIIVVAVGVTLLLCCQFVIAQIKQAAGYSKMLDKQEEDAVDFEARSDLLDDIDPSVHSAPLQIHKGLRPALSEPMPTVGTPPATHNSAFTVQTDVPRFAHVPEIQANIDYLHATIDDIRPCSRAESIGIAPPAARTPVPPHPMEFRHVFETDDDLHIYVLRVHILGFVLWGTVIAVDFSHPCLILFFTTGLFAGLLLSKLSRMTLRKEFHACFVLVYCILQTLLIVMSYIYSQIDYTDMGLFVFFLVTFCTGVVWGMQEPSSMIIPTCHNAFITSTLMSIPMLFLQITTDKAKQYIVQDVSQNIYVLAVEPLMKFLQVYIIVVSAQTNKMIELTIILACTLCVQIMFQYNSEGFELQQPVLITAAVTITLMLLSYTAHLLARSRKT